VALPDPASEDGSPAASQRAIGKKKLVRFVRGGLAARMKDNQAQREVPTDQSKRNR
jgi:hypothetical protein